METSYKFNKNGYNTEIILIPSDQWIELGLHNPSWGPPKDHYLKYICYLDVPDKGRWMGRGDIAKELMKETSFDWMNWVQQITIESLKRELTKKT